MNEPTSGRGTGLPGPSPAVGAVGGARLRRCELWESGGHYSDRYTVAGGAPVVGRRGRPRRLCAALSCWAVAHGVGCTCTQAGRYTRTEKHGWLRTNTPDPSAVRLALSRLPGPVRHHRPGGPPAHLRRRP